jgi:hypothetical protein
MQLILGLLFLIINSITNNNNNLALQIFPLFAHACFSVLNQLLPFVYFGFKYTPSEINTEQFIPRVCPSVYFTSTHIGSSLVVFPVLGNKTVLLVEKERKIEALNKAPKAFIIYEKRSM